MFFDDKILTSMFFPTLHDAKLQALDKYREQSVVRNLLATYHNLESATKAGGGCNGHLKKMFYLPGYLGLLKPDIKIY